MLNIIICFKGIISPLETHFILGALELSGYNCLSAPVGFSTLRGIRDLFNDSVFNSRKLGLMKRRNILSNITILRGRYMIGF